MWALVASLALALAAPAGEVYEVTIETQVKAPESKPAPDLDPEMAAAFAARMNRPQVVTRIVFNSEVSRQEIVSGDFVLPAGTFVLHRSGSATYLVGDPRGKTYFEVDANALLAALEGGAGITSEQYQARVEHTAETRQIAGYTAKKSIVHISYVSVIPFETDQLQVPQQNDVEVWHTADLPAQAVMDHVFVKYNRDKSGVVKKALSELGFPLEVTVQVTQGRGKKVKQPGSLHVRVTSVKKGVQVPAELFQMPPAGYKSLERNPNFQPGKQADETDSVAGGQQ